MLLDAASIDHIPPHEWGCKTPDTKDHSNGGQQAVVEHAFHFAVSSLWMCEQFPWLLPELQWLFKRLQLHRSCRKRTPCWWQWWNYTRTPHGGFTLLGINHLVWCYQSLPGGGCDARLPAAKLVCAAPAWECSYWERSGADWPDFADVLGGEITSHTFEKCLGPTGRIQELKMIDLTSLRGS